MHGEQRLTLLFFLLAWLKNTTHNAWWSTKVTTKVHKSFSKQCGNCRIGLYHRESKKSVFILPRWRSKYTHSMKMLSSKVWYQPLQPAVIDASWVSDAGFFANTSIRATYLNEKDALFGKDRLEVKPMDELCDEIQICQSKKVEIMFHTASEVRGYGDQMLYWRW